MQELMNVKLASHDTLEREIVMTKEEMKRLLDEKPFRPFKVKVAGDGEYPVPSLDHVHIHPNGRLLFIHLNDGSTAIIDVPLISSVHLKEAI